MLGVMEERLSPAEYESLVHTLVGQFRAVLGNDALRGGKANRIPGASGFLHQIDVSIHMPDKLVLLECKLLKRAVSAHSALVLAARLQDIRQANPSLAISGSLVSTKPVTSGVLKLAQHFEFSVDLVNSLQDYTIHILNVHFAGLSSRIQFSDACKAEILPASSSARPTPVS